MTHYSLSVRSIKYIVLQIAGLALLVGALSACSPGLLEIGFDPASTVTGGAAESTVVIPPPMTPTPVSQNNIPRTPQPVNAPMSPAAYPAPGGLRVAYVVDGDLWLWTAERGETHRLTSGGGVTDQVKISDDGALVVFRRQDELWVVRSDGADERTLISDSGSAETAFVDSDSVLNRFEWVPHSHHLAFNTRQRDNFRTVLNDDLHLLYVDTADHAVLLPSGEGGEFYYSPDGSQITIVTPDEISLVDADGGNRRQGVLSYTPVATSSSYDYYARPAWAADGSALLVAIPPVDPEARPPQLTTIWRIPGDGSPAQLLTSIDAAPSTDPSVVQFSSDHKFAAYIQVEGMEDGATDAVQFSLRMIRLENGDWMALPEVSGFYGWAPDSKQLAFETGRQNPQLQIGQYSGPLFPSTVDAGVPVSDFSWVDSDSYLFVTRQDWMAGAEGDSWSLRLGNIDGESTILAESTEWLPYGFAVKAPASAVQPMLEETGSAPILDPPPGLVYLTYDGLWMVNEGGHPVQIFEQGGARLSPMGNKVLYGALGDGDLDLWLADLTSGDRRWLTNTPDRTESCATWWPARPDLILFCSRPEELESGPGITGFPTAMRLDGTDYRVLDDQHHTGDWLAPSPNGQTIAYGAGSGWLYHLEGELEQFDPADYGLTAAKGVDIGSPSWSPDGQKIAWFVNGGLAADGDYRMGIAVFDLERSSSRILYLYAPAGRGGWPFPAAWSPDGQWLAVSVGSLDPAESGLWVMRVDGEQEETFRFGWGGTPVWSPDGEWLALMLMPDNSPPGFWRAATGSWELDQLDLPTDAYLQDWIDIQGN